MQPHEYHLFISHSWDYREDRVSLSDLIIKGLPYANQVLDYSAPKDHPIHNASQNELIEALYQRIGNARVLIFPAGVYASYSKWIPIEIEIAQRLQKPIIAVEKWGSLRSTSMTQYAQDVVGWNSSSIGSAIDRWHS
jgi:hypothetical protein